MNQLVEIESKIKALHDAQGQTNVDIKKLLGQKDEPREKVPPAVRALRKELNQKHRSLNDLRQRWCTEKAEGKLARRKVQAVEQKAKEAQEWEKRLSTFSRVSLIGAEALEGGEPLQVVQGENSPKAGPRESALHSGPGESALQVRQYGSMVAPHTGLPKQHQRHEWGADYEAAVRIAAVPAHVHFTRVRLSLGGLGEGLK